MKNSLFFLLIIFLFISCGSGHDTEYPKPRGYFRIDMPEKEYRYFDTTYPYSFRYPVYAEIHPDSDPDTEPYWINIFYPDFNGMLSFSYKKIDDNLYQLSEDARAFANKHIIKANEIRERRIEFPEHRVFGVVYEIEGNNTASPYQFYVCDSSKHFIRAALYFNHIPNNDSVAPIIQRVKEDMDTLLSSLQWKEL